MASPVFASTTFKPSTAASQQVVIGGEAIAVGDAVYRDPTLNKYFLSDANSSTPFSGGATSPQTVDGVCSAACAGDGCSMALTSGVGAVIDTGATTTVVMAAGDVLVLSTTPGKLQVAPATSGSKLIIVATATTATQMKLVLSVGGTAP
jgi:hypothetical protein